MVIELEKSAEILALNEKESAWKEMAKQVAHEIKNPLTPMKLSVQIFEKNLNPKDPNFKKKLNSFSSSMVEQINSLANIANAFSLFAQMPPDNKEPIDIVKITEKTLVLFESINIVTSRKPLDDKFFLSFIDLASSSTLILPSTKSLPEGALS